MKKALIVVDYQNDFVDGSLGSPAAIAISENIQDKIKNAQADGYDIIFTKDTHSEDYLQTAEGRHLPVEHCLKGTPGHDLYPPVEALRRPEDMVIEKGVFGSDELYEYLKDHPYDALEFVGLVSDICVISNVVLAKTALPEAQISVDAACVAGTSPEADEAVFKVLNSLQVDVENVSR